MYAVVYPARGSPKKIGPPFAADCGFGAVVMNPGPWLMEDWNEGGMPDNGDENDGFD